VIEYPTVADAGSPEAAPAAASAGVFVIAPAYVPAIRAGDMSNAWPSPQVTPAPIANTATVVRTIPPDVRMTWKKFGPEVMPIAKAKRARPITPTSWGTCSS